MNRPIKFRAWDGEKKEMYYWTLNDLLCRFGNKEYADDYTASPLFEWTQYTGLHDKNGKEIYEGDILRNGDEGSTFNAGIGVVEYVTNNSVGHPINGYWAALYDEAFTIYPKQCEVIGNIHENPELLK